MGFSSDSPIQGVDPKNQNAMVKLINTEGPRVLGAYYRNPNSFFDSNHFENIIEKLTKVLEAFPELLVGLDLMGDELGYPFIPFTIDIFRSFIQKYSLGVRIHSGENPLYSSDPCEGLPVHMAILTLGIMRLVEFIPNGKLRIGHGTAWISMLDLYRMPSEISSKGQILSNFIFVAMGLIKQIPCEINITSNEYLLHSDRIPVEGKQSKDACEVNECLLHPSRITAPGIVKVHPLTRIQAETWPFVLSTDNDGIWPIEQCPMNHPHHHALAGEYCKAIHKGFINTKEALFHAVTTGVNHRFYEAGGNFKKIIVIMIKFVFFY